MRTPAKTSEPDLRPERIRANRAAAILGVNKRTIQAMALRGDLPRAARIGGLWTFEEAALRDYIEARIQPPSKKTDLRLPNHTDRFIPLSDRRAQQACEEARMRLRERAREERRGRNR